jgi:hypothetical protein
LGGLSSNPIVVTGFKAVLWVCTLLSKFCKTYGIRELSLYHYLLSFVPGPWVILHDWTLDEYWKAKKPVKLPEVLGGVALPSFISNPLELLLLFVTLIVSLNAVLEVVGLLSKLLCSKKSPAAAGSAAAGSGDSEYSLWNVWYLSLAQWWCNFVLFSSNIPAKDFSKKYAFLPEGFDFFPASFNAALHIGLVVSCLAVFLRYTLFGLAFANMPKPHHGQAMSECALPTARSPLFYPITPPVSPSPLSHTHTHTISPQL